MRKVTVKVFEQISPDELSKLIEGLKKIEGFEFLVDAQTKIKIYDEVPLIGYPAS